MPRTRKKRTRDLPANLYETGNGFYRYRHPQTKRWHGMGSNRRDAIASAHKLNSELLPAPDRTAKILKPRPTLNTFLNTWENEILPSQPLAEETRKWYLRKLPHIRKALGHLAVDTITVGDCATFLDSYGNTTQSNHFRAMLSIIFKQAIAKGLCSDNPAAATLKKRVKVQRQRMTLEQFHAIRAHADDWLQNCINLGLLTLQRREDLASLMWSDVHDGFIWIQQRKVEKWGTGNLKIRITPEIQAILDRSNDGVESEHVIHRRAHRRVHAAKRTDLNAVLPGLITKHFAAARLASGIFPSDQASATLPSFHEIRALGANQLEAQGKPPELIQALLGHTTKAMTDVYLDRHQIRWVEVDTQEY